MDIIKSIEHEQLKNKIPDLKVGDTVRVHQRIKEGNRQRIQVFEGIIIKKQGGGVNATFTVRRVAYGVGTEKTFLLHSPLVEKVEVVRVGKARRAKLYYLRDRIGKASKTKEDIAAKIETKHITLKEEVEVVPGENEVAENAENTEEIVQEEVKPVEENDEVKAENEAEVKEEAKTEEVAEEVKEEKVEEPAVEEKQEENKEEVVEEEKIEEAKEEETTTEE